MAMQNRIFIIGVTITTIPPRNIPPPHHQLCIPMPNAMAITMISKMTRDEASSLNLPE